MSRRKQMPARKMKPVFLVFCEGQSEAVYIEFLKQTFRSPIKVITDIVGTNISQSLVTRKTKEIKLSPHGPVSVFLMYDMDVEHINKKIEDCKCGKILSNPCFEVWYLLHSKKLTVRLESNECIKKLKESSHVWTSYEKGKLTDSQKNFLASNIGTATASAKQLREDENPYTNVYQLVDALSKQPGNF